MKRILIIDDTEFARMMLRDMLQAKGYEICGEAEDGRQGVEKFKQLRPDLTLCDIRMNGMNGMDCIKRIMSEDPNAKIIVCAAINSEEKIYNVLKLGVKGIVEKPIHVDKLVKLVEKALNEPFKNRTYKDLMEVRTSVEGIGLNSFLDFCSAFKSINGFALDDPKADKQYLSQNADEMLIGMRALLSAKMPLEQLNKLESIFLDISDSQRH